MAICDDSESIGVVISLTLRWLRKIPYKYMIPRASPAKYSPIPYQIIVFSLDTTMSPSTALSRAYYGLAILTYTVLFQKPNLAPHVCTLAVITC